MASCLGTSDCLIVIEPNSIISHFSRFNFRAGQFVDETAAVWAAAAVSADLFVLAAADTIALAAVVLTSRACGAVNACLAVDPGPGSAVALVHVAEYMSVESAISQLFGQNVF